MSKRLFFISKDSNWQLYRNEVLTKLAATYNYKVEILTTGKVETYLKENNHLHYRKFINLFGNKTKISLFIGAIWHVLKERPYAVLAVNNTTQLTEYLMLIFCKLFRIKFIWWTHGYDHNPKLEGVLKKVKDKYSLFFLKKADSIITFSQLGKDYLVKNGICSSIIFPALNTLDTDKLIQLKQKTKEGFDKKAFLNSLFPECSEPENAFTLLFSGRLKRDKKVANAIQAVKQLNDLGRLTNLIVIGDGEDRTALQKLTYKLGLTDNVYFGGKVFDDKKISQFFLASDLFIMPGYVGLAIVHAFAYALPIITEDITFHSPEIQYLKDGINGYFVPKDNIDMLSRKIQNLAGNKALLDSFKRAALKTIEEEANISLMIKKMNKAIELNN